MLLAGSSPRTFMSQGEGREAKTQKRTDGVVGKTSCSSNSVDLNNPELVFFNFYEKAPAYRR